MILRRHSELHTTGMSFNDPVALVGPKINFGKRAKFESQGIFRCRRVEFNEATDA